MPFTVNGVGTRYFGRKNLDSETGGCEFCRRVATLQSYSTTLWFTVVYLPILPLGKRQILSECGACRKHCVLTLSKWEALRSQTIADARAAAEAAPLDPQPTIRLLGALVGCFARDEALALAGDVATRFPRHAGALLAAAACFEKYGLAPEAERAYWAALNADPANLAAKQAIAWRLVERRDLVSAEQLVSAAPPLTAEQDPGLFVKLGHAYQAEGRSAEALATFAAALAVAPQLGQDAANRKAIAAAERAAGATSTLLLNLSLWRRFPWLAPALGAAAAATIALAVNFYVAEHQTLHIVNGFATPLLIRMEDGRRMDAPPHAQVTATIAEGHHLAQMSAGGRDLGGEPFEISSSVWARFFRPPTYVLNPCSGAALLWEKVSYTAAPQPAAGEDRLIVGLPFYKFDEIDFPFEQFPQALRVKHGETVTKTRVSLSPADVMSVLAAPDHLLSVEERLKLAEAHLRVTPNDPRLRDFYTAASAKVGAGERARQFLASLGQLAR